jgi:hypothetical protein
MHETEVSTMPNPGLQTFKRNRYHHGQLLDVFHFELETNYFNAKRWLINRLVCGYGVVCGLNVLVGPEKDQILVDAGVALDKCGREIVVARQTAALTIPADLIRQAAEAYKEEEGKYQRRQEQEEEEEEACVQVVLCYQECLTDPIPVLVGDCESYEPCTPGIIREQYRIEFRLGCAPPIEPSCRIPDVIVGNRVDYPTLARWVSEGCPEVPDDCCIPLANVHILPGDQGHGCDQNNIDITIRPIVYSNDLLFELVLALTTEDQHHKPWSK